MRDARGTCSALPYAHLLAFRRWRRALDAEGTRPAANEVARVRRLVMIQAHLMPLIPLAAVFLARGYGH